MLISLNCVVKIFQRLRWKNLKGQRPSPGPPCGNMPTRGLMADFVSLDPVLSASVWVANHIGMQIILINLIVMAKTQAKKKYWRQSVYKIISMNFTIIYVKICIRHRWWTRFSIVLLRKAGFSLNLRENHKTLINFGKGFRS